MSHLAKCNYKDCPLKNECKRYLDEEDVSYVKFQNLLEDGECKWFIKLKTDVVKKD